MRAVAGWASLVSGQRELDQQDGHSDQRGREDHAPDPATSPS